MNITKQAELNAAPKGVLHDYTGNGVIEIRYGQLVNVRSGCAYVFKGGRTCVRQGGCAYVFDGGYAYVFDGGIAYVYEGGIAYMHEGGYAYVHEGGQWVRKDGPCTVDLRIKDKGPMEKQYPKTYDLSTCLAKIEKWTKRAREANGEA